MADKEAKDVPDKNEEVVESVPQDVPDPNPIQNEGTGISESHATDGTEITQTEERHSVEPPADIQETTNPATVQPADGTVPDAAASVATDGEAVQDAKVAEATEQSKADEDQDEGLLENLDTISLEQLLNIDDETFELLVREEGKKEKEEAKMENYGPGQLEARSSIIEKKKETEKKEHDDKSQMQILHRLSSRSRSSSVHRDRRRSFYEDSAERAHVMEQYQNLRRLSTCSSNKGKDKERRKSIDDDYNERAQLMEQYQQSILTRDHLQQQNAMVQQKLVKFFKMKKTDDSCTDPKNVADLEQRYLKLMAQIEELQVEQEAEKTAQTQRTNELENQFNEKKKRVESDQRKLHDMKKHVAQQAVNSRSGKPIPEKDIEQYLANEEKKDVELDNVRLENIKLKNRLKKKEMQRKSKEGLADGLRLIDFEQLKIENQTYNEKIEERIEELHKLDKKIKSTAEVQTHMTEKLQFIQVENEVLSKELQEIETEAAQKRDELSRTKQMRDALKRSNSSLHKNCGLLGNRLLLRNFEDQKDENERLLQELENLKMTFAEYTMQAKQVQQKINQATQHMGFQQK